MLLIENVFLFIEKCLSHNQILFFTSKLKEKSNIQIFSYKFSYSFFLYSKKMQMNQQVKGNNTFFLVMLISAEQKNSNEFFKEQGNLEEKCNGKKI